MTIDPATLKIRYPAFAAVDDAVITYWLTDAAAIVDERFGAEQEVATFELAAHNLVTTPGVLTASNDEEAAVAKVKGLGVTSFRSGSFSVTLSDAAISQQIAGGYGSSVYGQRFAAMLKRALGGPRLVVGGAYPGCNAGFNGFAGPLPTWQC